MAAKRATHVKGTRTALVAPAPIDYDWLYSLATSSSDGYRWRLRGRNCSPEQFTQLLWQDCAAQWVIWDRDVGTRIGLVQILSHDAGNGFAYLSAILSQDHMRSGWPLEGVLLAIDSAFRTWNLRKLYFESAEFSLVEYKSALGGFLSEECRLREHEFWDGAWHDHVILALYREKWDEVRPRLDRLFGAEN